jgi:hypothetical protein
MHWILILMLGGFHDHVAAATTAIFDSELSCETAGDRAHKRAQMQLTWICAPQSQDGTKPAD